MRQRVLEEAARRFPRENAASVIEILDAYGTESHERERDRVQLAILRLSGGDVEELRLLVTHAKRDYRDVLYWTELAEGRPDPLADRLADAVLTPELTPKRLALLREAAPGVSRVAVLWSPANDSHPGQLRELEAAARGLEVAVQPFATHRPAELDGAFTAMGHAHVEALVLLTSAMHQLNLHRIAELALAAGLPGVCELHGFTRAGGLMSYGPTEADMARRAAAHIGERLRRSGPAAGRPGRVELRINLKTARTLRLAIPESLVRRADDVIR